MSGMEMTLAGSGCSEFAAALWGIGVVGPESTTRIGVVLDVGCGRSGTSVTRTAEKFRFEMFRS
jgi:hypothetical protein